MASTDSVGETLAAVDAVEADAIVVGGGVAGLSAAVFLARYGLETLVCARGTAAIDQCAHLENYLGFPGGISPERFLELGRTQAKREGVTISEEQVEHVRRADLPTQDAAGVDTAGTDPDTGGFHVVTDENDYRSRYLLVATAYDGEMLEPFEAVDTEAEEDFLDSNDGRTAVEGLYAAGWMTDETVHQAVVSAGHGGRAALSMIRDDVAARYWPAVGEQYVDWVVDDGRYGGDDWAAHTREWFTDEILVDDVEEPLETEALEYLRSEFRTREIREDERVRRDRMGQRLLLEHLDDEVIREYVEQYEVA